MYSSQISIMSKVEKKRISHEEYMSGKWQNVFIGSELTDPHDGTSSKTYYEARVSYNDDGSVNENSYTDSWQRKNKLGCYKEETSTSTSNSSSSSSGKPSSSTSSDDNGSCVKFIFTIIPILPIWWLIKLFIKAGAAAFVLIWWLIKAIFYIISWPIRILLYCCLDKEKRRFLPKWTFDIMPAYSFKKF